ncbi:MAG TPA: hypothetical protein VFD21_13215 [Vicinamibacterales bacterium]|nr:hypothetical protein [Vicinamibacterales bacterium]
MAQAFQRVDRDQSSQQSQHPSQQGQQLALHNGWMAALRRSTAAAPASRPALCAGCREREARYGFRDDEDDPTTERPRTLCFSCFRVELTRRQAVRDRLARGWNGQQVSLPLEETLKTLTQRRRRAQIAARHALGL